MFVPRAAARRRPRRGDRPGPRRPHRAGSRRAPACSSSTSPTRARPRSCASRRTTRRSSPPASTATSSGSWSPPGCPTWTSSQPGFFRREEHGAGDATRTSSGPAPSTTGCRTSRRPAPTAREREQLVECDDVAIPAADAGLGTVAVVGFDVHDPATTDTTRGDHAERDGLRLGRPPLPGQLGLPRRLAGLLLGRAAARAADGVRRRHHVPLRLRPRRHRHDVRRLRRGRRLDRRPLVDGRARRRAAGRGRADHADRQLQLDRDALAGGRATWSRSAASTGSASTRRSSRCAGSTTSRSW